ncbi:DUF262 domain-containing protein [Marinibactrum halimedae]|uniref:GmrSD restriction endonucleases N-terminal domain-containing protein n=1 Tax=Marinibactrum halimedae TaxID=1444977 RepID=A0AA37T9W4_9GAMM|nr:DUF262 domain-containing protein [Marinibactrum halimedae]MCD9460023.1 DUF262 domain-containing protein [Marinibactrum halimedae]GLS28209.1 hypothetical protein GCM10007877_39280 [Marinibactrum halimedae]
MVKKKSVEIDEERIREAESAISTVARQVKFNVAEYPVSMYVSRFSNDVGDRYFVPEYQRNARWSDEQKSQFIESLIVGLPIPFMFFYQTHKGTMEIVDGSQRMRAMRSFLKENLILSNLVLVPELNGFTFDDLPGDRKNKLEDVTIRTIILDTDTDPSTRAEMFARINRMGTSAEPVEIRRGSLPGPVTTLIDELAKSEQFAVMTPLSTKLINKREREELITRFFAYINTYDTDDGRFPGYRDRPSKFLFDYLKNSNKGAEDNPEIIQRMREEFLQVLEFVQKTFPLGFRKSSNAKTIPRVRFEAIAVGSGLALRENPDLKAAPDAVIEKMNKQNFDRIVVSDGANVRSKLEGRVDFIKNILLQK